MKLSELFSDTTAGLGDAARKALEGLRPNTVQKIIDEETSIFDQPTQITVRNKIPDTRDIPIENPTYWLRIPDVVACFVDMEGSTKLSATTHDRSTAKAYRYFTNTAIRIFHHFEAPYIDVKGDGVFALFDNDKVYTATPLQALYGQATSASAVTALDFLQRTLWNLPIALPAIWGAWWANRKSHMYDRLAEEYRQKEAISNAFVGYTKQLKELGNSEALNDYLVLALKEVCIPAGRIYNDKMPPGTPAEDTLGQVKDMVTGIATAASRKPAS